MKISLLEPIGISNQAVEAFAKRVEELGHEFSYYPEKTTDVVELIK